MASIEQIKASDGSGNANVATVQNTRTAGATTIIVDTVLGINGAGFTGSMGTPHTFTDPITSETITVISEATAVDFVGHVDGSNLEIDAIAPGYTDAGSAVGDIVIIRPTTQYSDNLADVLDASHNDNGTLKVANNGFISDENGNEQLKFQTTAAAVNETSFKNAATGSAPKILVTGGDTNIDIDIVPKGTGKAKFGGIYVQSGAKVYHNTTQSIPDTTETTVAFNSEVYDTESYHDNSTNNSRLTIPVTGRYKVGCLFTFASWDTSTARRLYAAFRVNGSTSHRFIDFTLTASAPAWSAEIPLNLTAANYVELRVSQNTTASRNISANEAFTAFWITRIG